MFKLKFNFLVYYKKNSTFVKNISMKCPKCGQDSLTRRPEGRLFNHGVTVANEYRIVCMAPKCGYQEQPQQVKTEFGEKISKPWYKQLFG